MACKLIGKKDGKHEVVDLDTNEVSFVTDEELLGLVDRKTARRAAPGALKADDDLKKAQALKEAEAVEATAASEPAEKEAKAEAGPAEDKRVKGPAESK